MSSRSIMRGLRIVSLFSAAWTAALSSRVDALGLHADSLAVEGLSAAPADSPVSPCEDSLFVALKSKPLGSMTFTEYTYFMAKSGECFEHERGKAPAPREPAPAPVRPPPVEVRRKTPTAVHAAIVAAMVAAVVYLVAKG